MDTSLNEKVKQSIQNLKDKKSRIYFLVQDTKGNAKASVRLIYQMAKSLLDAGFNPIILHEKKEYAGVVAWLSGSLLCRRREQLCVRRYFLAIGCVACGGGPCRMIRSTKALLQCDSILLCVVGGAICQRWLRLRTS